MLQRTSHSHHGFTLVELMIAMTIFGMMSVMVMTIYLSTTQTARRLDAQRLLAESARSIIERLTEDVGKYGFSGSAPAFDTSTTHTAWSKNDYTGSGSEYLNIKTGRYVYGVRKSGGIDPCIGDKKTKPDTHCGLYLVSYADNGAAGYNLVDSFTPDEDKKRVKIQDLKFYTSGDGTSATMKTTLVMDLALMPRSGVSNALIETTRLHIQTTISERGWKNK